MAFKYTDHLITPGDIYRGILHVKTNMRVRDVLGIVLVGMVYAYSQQRLGWQVDSSVFFCFLFAIFFWDLDPRIPIALALIFLVLCPILLFLGDNYYLLEAEDWAETSAVWAYYCLVFGVLKQMWDFRREGKDGEGSEER